MRSCESTLPERNDTSATIRRKRRIDPNGIRTRVTAVKGRCPGPLDDRVTKPGNIGIAIVRRKVNWLPNLSCRRNPNGASLLVSRSEIVNQLGCPRGSAFVFVQRCMRIFHETLAQLAVAKKLANGTLERVGIVNLHCGVI
jgi:hypothetical protein